MVRPAAATRPATSDDIPQLVELCRELRAAGGRPARALDRTMPDPEPQLRQVLADPGKRTVVATVDGDVVGMTVMSLIHVGMLGETAAVQMTSAVVRRGYRRRGVGHALIAAAAAFAEERAVESVVVSVYPALREANRFYARLGFAPFSVRRSASVSVLRRRLATRERLPRMTEDFSRRRLMRARPAPAQRAEPPPMHEPQP